jgi:hypothetical protein
VSERQQYYLSPPTTASDGVIYVVTPGSPYGDTLTDRLGFQRISRRVAIAIDRRRIKHTGASAFAAALPLTIERDSAEEPISEGEFSRRMHVHPATVGRWIAKGLIRDYLRTAGGHYRIAPGEVERLKSQRS